MILRRQQRLNRRNRTVWDKPWIFRRDDHGGGGGEDSHANRGGDARRTSQGLKSWVLVPLRDQSEFKLGGGVEEK